MPINKDNEFFSFLRYHTYKQCPADLKVTFSMHWDAVMAEELKKEFPLIEVARGIVKESIDQFNQFIGSNILFDIKGRRQGTFVFLHNETDAQWPKFNYIRRNYSIVEKNGSIFGATLKINVTKEEHPSRQFVIVLDPIIMDLYAPKDIDKLNDVMREVRDTTLHELCHAYMFLRGFEFNSIYGGHHFEFLKTLYKVSKFLSTTAPIDFRGCGPLTNEPYFQTPLTIKYNEEVSDEDAHIEIIAHLNLFEKIHGIPLTRLVELPSKTKAKKQRTE